MDVLEASPDIREWVLQRYIPDPLLINGHKFHLRVYVVCVGAMRVFVCNHILMLLAAHKCVIYSQMYFSLSLVKVILRSFSCQI